MKERELIEFIRTLTKAEGPGLVQAIGDDCAVIEKDGVTVRLLTMDTLVASVHFDMTLHPPRLLGRKAVSVNVSDIAAMGGRPAFVLLSLGLPAGFDESWALDLCRGITGACRQYGCQLIGGDTVRTPGNVALTLTVIGEMERDRVLYRRMARVGDIIWVTGPLGLSAAGLDLLRKGIRPGDSDLQPLFDAHLDPLARTDFGPLLAQSGMVHAMMDLSDGLATDLSHLCACSGVGAEIFQDRLPGIDQLGKAQHLLCADSLKWILAGGEDYELLFTASSGRSSQLKTLAREHNLQLHGVGRIVEGQGVKIYSTEGAEEEQDITYMGFDHFNKS
jgi:thiamine-monophosphate kinase